MPRNRAYSISEVATILGISASRVARDVRFGTIRSERRRGSLVVTEREVMRLLDGTGVVQRSKKWSHVDNSSYVDTLNPVLRYRDVPTDVLVDIVRDGCADPRVSDTAPLGETDAEIAAQTCESCRAPYACLALEFRVEGRATVGVWGGLPEDERRALFAAWAVESTAAENGGEWS